jgi:single-strand DNA-binding protein
MSRCINQALLIGRVGASPDVRTTASGQRVATLRVATGVEGRGGEAGRTQWHRIVAWDALAQVAEREVRTGDRIFVDGQVEYRSWTDRGGRTRHVTEIVAAELIPLHDRTPVEPFRWRSE